MKLNSLIRKQLCGDMTIGLIFDYPVIRQLATQLEKLIDPNATDDAKPKTKLLPWAPLNETIATASPAQQRIYMDEFLKFGRSSVSTF